MSIRRCDSHTSKRCRTNNDMMCPSTCHSQYLIPVGLHVQNVLPCLFRVHSFGSQVVHGTCTAHHIAPPIHHWTRHWTAHIGHDAIKSCSTTSSCPASCHRPPRAQSLRQRAAWTRATFARASGQRPGSAPSQRGLASVRHENEHHQNDSSAADVRSTILVNSLEFNKDPYSPQRVAQQRLAERRDKARETAWLSRARISD